MDIYEANRDRLPRGIQTIPSAEWDLLKGKILSCFDSDDMKGYLAAHFIELSSADLIDIVIGALRPMEFKLNLLTELARWFPHPLEEMDDFYDFEPYIELYNSGLDETKNNESGVYLLKQYDHHETDGYSWEDYITFQSFQAAVAYIKDNAAEWLDWTFGAETVDEALTWFEIEKWNGNERMSLRGTYTVSKYGEVWDYCAKDNHLHHKFGASNALSLYLPVPFIAGDVISIDCRPFAPYKHGVVLSVGDNVDCCCVQCLYVKSDGILGVGALKHSHVFDDGYTPFVSPLYKAQKVQENLPEDEEGFYEIGDMVAKMYTQWKKQEDFTIYNDRVLNGVHRLVEEDNTLDKLMQRIRNTEGGPRELLYK